MVLAVPDEPARGRKPVLRDELAAVVAKQQYPRERLLILYLFETLLLNGVNEYYPARQGLPINQIANNQQNNNHDTHTVLHDAGIKLMLSQWMLHKSLLLSN